MLSAMDVPEGQAFEDLAPEEQELILAMLGWMRSEEAHTDAMEVCRTAYAEAKRQHGEDWEP